MMFNLLRYRVTQKHGTEEQIAPALPVSRGAAAVLGSKGSEQQLAAWMELEPALSSLPGRPQ